MAEIIIVDDLPTAMQSAELVDDMVAGANAKASRVAPCLTWNDEDENHPAPSEDQLAEARLVLLGAVKRWVEAGSGAFQAQSAGPFAVTTDTRQRTGFNLWPTEIISLQEICASPVTSGAFSVDTAPCFGGIHLPWCSINFGAYCSCGVDIATEPIFELG